MKASIQISEEGLGDQAVCPDRAVCEVMRVEPKVQWRPQETGDARNVEHLSKAARSEQSHLMKETENCNHQQCHRGRAAQALWSSNLVCPHNLFQVWGMELQGLMFAMMDFGVVLNLLVSIPFYLLLVVEIFTLCH